MPKLMILDKKHMKDSSLSRSLLLGAALFGLAVLPGCSTAPKEPETVDVDSDPLEGFNRAMYHFNYGVDVAVLRPVSWVYLHGVPEEGREMVGNFVENINAPVDLANSVFQGDGYNSSATLWRFLINTSFGIGGLFDPAAEIGLKARHADFGQTLAFWGVDSGPYLVLPLLGPSTVRDGIGKIPDTALQPINWMEEWWPSLTLAGVKAVDFRANNMDLIDDTYRDSIDPYATFRSGYLQHRAAEIRKAKASRDRLNK